MAVLDTGEPFGLPRGTVRGIIALAFTAVTLFLFGTGQAPDGNFLAITTLIIGNYFGARASEAPAPAPEPDLPAPAVGDVD